MTYPEAIANAAHSIAVAYMWRDAISAVAYGISVGGVICSVIVTIAFCGRER